jgi:hypothetical protein
MVNLSKGNTKLNKPNGGVYNIIGFGLPADHDFKGGNTCPGASACRAICFAKQGTYRFKGVKRTRLANLEASQTEGFVADVLAGLARRRKVNAVRVHDSGDFYDQAYLDKWYEIARNRPDMVFYAYTKSLHLDLWTHKPDNFRLVQSLGGRRDGLVDLTKPHSRIFSSHEAREAAGYEDGNANELPALEGVVKIGLVYHGGRNLTPAQERYWG